MKLVVLLKEVPDTMEVRIREDLTIDREHVSLVMNPADESALEWAIRTRARFGGELTAMTMGPKRSETVLKEALKRGADRAAHLTDRSFAGADTLITARCLDRAIDHLGGADVIVCGRRAADGETGQVGPMIASMRHIACVTNAIAADPYDGGVTVRQLTESGVRVWKCAYPVMVTFCEWSYRLRLPSLKGLRAAREHEVLCLTPGSLGLSADECGLRASPTRVTRIESRPVGARNCSFLDRESVMPVIRKAVREEEA